MTCKDCIHYPICQRFTGLGYSISEERKDLEVHCKFFAEHPRWHYEFPAEDNRDTLLLVASGSSMIGEERFTLKNAIVLGCYMGNGTWFLEDYPEIDDAKVLCWAPTLYWEGKR